MCGVWRPGGLLAQPLSSGLRRKQPVVAGIPVVTLPSLRLHQYLWPRPLSVAPFLIRVNT